MELTGVVQEVLKASHESLYKNLIITSGKDRLLVQVPSKMKDEAQFIRTGVRLKVGLLHKTHTSKSGITYNNIYLEKLNVID